MTTTYVTPQSTDKDWVRFHVGDTDINNAEFTDEEIQAVIDEETATGKALKYFASATLLGVLLLKYVSKGKGVQEKALGKLRIKYGSGETFEVVMNERIKQLRKRGAWLMSGSPKQFRVMGAQGRLRGY